MAQGTWHRPQRRPENNKMKDIYLTYSEAEEIVMAAEIGMYNIDAPGARSKLAHARLMIHLKNTTPAATSSGNK